MDRFTGTPALSGRTILIKTGALRDSWVQKGARGHVEEVEGDGLFIGSQLTVGAELQPGQAAKPYHLLTKKAQRARARGKTVLAQIPLARFQEEGTKHIPSRRVGVVQEEDLKAIAASGSAHLTGQGP